MRSNLLPGTGILADPNQARTLFNPGTGPHPVRQKHLFLVRFMRSQNSDNTFLPTDVTFVVKQMDRPSVQPQVEEVNQYNKKRVITTGVKYTPVNLTLYDTADGAAMNMWLDYARYYFGDYNQTEDTNNNFGSWRDDILDPAIADGINDPGFGFNIRPQDNFTVDGAAGSQWYFDHIRVYQLWGNEYTSYDLIHPRINTFTPDDLDYSNSEANTIQMSITYEAIGHHNRGAPVDILSEASLVELFQTGPYAGQTIEVDGEPKQTSFVGTAPGGDLGIIGGGMDPSIRLGNLDGSADTSGSSDTGLLREFTNSDGGVLNRFGTFDFGTVDPTLSPHTVMSALQQAVGGSNPLANIVSKSFSGPVSAPTQYGLKRVSDNLSAALGSDALQLDDMASSVNIAAQRSGTSAMEQASKQGGLSLSNDAVNAFNEVKDGTFFVGFRKDV